MPVALFVLLGLAGVDTVQPPPPKPAEVAANPAKAQIKCEVIAPTGSRLARQRVCHDPAMRAQLDQERREFERIRQTSRPRIGD